MADGNIPDISPGAPRRQPRRAQPVTSETEIPGPTVPAAEMTASERTAPAAVYSGSSDAVLQTLAWLRKNGFRPVPLHFQSKAAIFNKYTARDYVPPDDALWKTKNYGVGVVTGPAHSGPVDIDLDCEEAVFFASKFLPPTPAVFGRKSKPRSHYLYRVEGDEIDKRTFNDPSAKQGIVELRADSEGHQTVMPGSVHQDTGELVEWSEVAFPEVPSVTFETLEWAVRKIAVATLISRYLWEDGQRNEVTKCLAGMLFYLEWEVAEVEDLIAAVMEYTGDDDGTRIKTVRLTFQKGEKGGKIVGATSLKKLTELDGVVDRIAEWCGSQGQLVLQEYNDRFAVVLVEGKFRIVETADMEKGEMPVFFQKDDFLNYMATDRMILPGAEKPIEKAKVWLASPKRRLYKTVEFLPGKEDASPVFNLWGGWPLTPRPSEGKDAASCQRWIELLFNVICGDDEDLFFWMVNWFAGIVQQPMKIPSTCPVLVGGQGAGKSMLLDYFGQILGHHYIVATKEEHIYGRFNKHLSTALLLHSAEALHGGDRKHRNIVKSMISDRYALFEQKGVDAKRINNYMRLILSSNEEQAAPVEKDDRRFTIIHMEGRKVDDALREAFLKEEEAGGPARLMDYLMKYEFDYQLSRVNYKTEAMLEMKQMNLDPVDAWWHEVLKAGQLLPDYLMWAARHPDKMNPSEWPQVLASPALHLAMREALRARNIRVVPDSTVFAIKLKRLLDGTVLVRSQMYYSNPMTDDMPREAKLLPSKMNSIKNMPTLQECRDKFERYIGHKLLWPEEAAPEDLPAYKKERKF